jgi:hypothetical protein
VISKALSGTGRAACIRRTARRLSFD